MGAPLTPLELFTGNFGVLPMRSNEVTPRVDFAVDCLPSEPGRFNVKNNEVDDGTRQGK
jgi:hypothetical protein